MQSACFKKLSDNHEAFCGTIEQCMEAVFGSGKGSFRLDAEGNTRAMEILSKCSPSLVDGLDSQATTLMHADAVDDSD